MTTAINIMRRNDFVCVCVYARGKHFSTPNNNYNNVVTNTIYSRTLATQKTKTEFIYYTIQIAQN